MLSTWIALFLGTLAGMTLVGWLSDKQSAQDKNLTPGLKLLPGDIKWQNESGNVKVYFPVTSSIVLSIVLSLAFWLFGKLG